MANSVTQTEKKEPNLESVMSWLTNVAEPAPVDPVLATQADEVVTKLMTVDPAQAEKVALNKQAIQNLGGELQREAARRSAMLRQPVHKLYEGVTQGAPVANALLDLKIKVEELHPGKYDFEPGWAHARWGGCRSLEPRSSATSVAMRQRVRNSTPLCDHCARAKSS